MNVESALPLNHTQDEISPIKDGDFVGEDGMIRCGACGKRKQFKIKIGNLEKIVPCICDCRAAELEKERKTDEYQQRMITISRMKTASMMANKYQTASFSKYKVRSGNKRAYTMSVKYVERFSEMKKKNQGLLFYGTVGTGKSYTAACIANELLQNCIPVIMTSFVKILQDIQGSKDEASYIQILNSASLLIIDDLGAERSTDYALEKVYNVVDSRIRAGKPLILTTNLDLSDMLDCQDIRYKRVYDRIFEACYPVQMSGESFRQMEAAERFDAMEALLK